MKVPTPFLYTSDKVVPWNYSSQTIIQEPQAAVEKKQEKSVNDIAGTGGITRSGRCYAPINPEIREEKSSAANERTKITAPKEKEKEPMNEPVTEKEAEEFLKFIKHSKYSIVEQLHKLPAKISLLALMMNFEPHREVVLKVLK